MRSIPCLVFLLILSSLPLAAQDTTSAAKLDSVLLYQRTMLAVQKQMYEELHYTEPLAGKTAGIEVNLARLLQSTNADFFTLSGTFSLFAVDRHAEVAFPFFYQDGQRKVTETPLFSTNETTYDLPMTLLNVDAVYRRFIGKHQDGFFFSVGTRYTYINGYEGSDFIIFSSGVPQNKITVSKLGAHFGIGYRYFTESGLYWGTSIVYGRYFSPDERDIREVLLDDTKVIMDVELLKVGFAF